MPDCKAWRNDPTWIGGFAFFVLFWFFTGICAVHLGQNKDTLATAELNLRAKTLFPDFPNVFAQGMRSGAHISDRVDHLEGLFFRHRVENHVVLRVTDNAILLRRCALLFLVSYYMYPRTLAPTFFFFSKKRFFTSTIIGPTEEWVLRAGGKEGV